MEIDCTEPPRSREEEAELGRSVKRVKENTGARQAFQPRTPVSYKDTLVGEIPGAYEQAFKFDIGRTFEDDTETNLEPLIEGMVDVSLFKETLMRIREPWYKALIVKVFGRNVGFSYLTFKIDELWKPAAKMECVDLGRDFFLIRFSCKDDFDKVLKGGPWFIGGHFLAIRPWEPYFKASEAKLTSVAVWIRFPELPIEFYDGSVLKEISSAIGPVLRIDAYTASGSRGSYARLCVQVDLEKPLINFIRIGKCRQSVLYEGISTLCFSCGRLGHTQDKCYYSIKQNERNGEYGEAYKMSERNEENDDIVKTQEVSQGSQSTPNYDPWMLVTRRRNPVRNGRGSAQVRGSVGSERQKGKFRQQVVDGDVNQKSPFRVLDTEVSDLAREDGTLLSQEVRLDDGERNTLVFQAGRVDPTADNQQKQIEPISKKAP